MKSESTRSDPAPWSDGPGRNCYSVALMAKIALFHPAFQTPGGAEFLCAQQARYLATHGDSVELVTLAFDAEKWAGRLEGLPVQVARKRHWTDPFFGVSRLAKLRTRGRRAAQRLAGCEVAVAHNHPCNAMLGASDLNIRKVWQCNEPPRGLHARKANPRLTHWVQQNKDSQDAASIEWRKVLRNHDAAVAAKRGFAARVCFDIAQTTRLDHIYAISEFSRDNARAIYGRCGQEVVYPMVRFPEPGKSRSGLDPSGLQVLVHSRLEVLKNIDTVIRGFAAFRTHHADARLHVVGDGAEGDSLKRIARKLMPQDAAIFHGFLPGKDLQAVYDACDVLALLTLDEPFGMVYPEAAARGLLLIGPDHGGPFEILEGGKLGWCVDPFSPEALAQALEEVAGLSDSEADRRRIAADQACRARFSESVIGPQLRRVILTGND